MDKHGHALVIGFSDEVDEEEVFKYGDGSRILIVKHAQLNQWPEHTIDLSSYWNKANWWQPEEIKVYLLISTYYSEPDVWPIEYSYSQVGVPNVVITSRKEVV